MDKQQLELSPEMKAAVAAAEVIHAGVMNYWNVVIVPFAESLHRAAISDLARIGSALQEAERRRISR